MSSMTLPGVRIGVEHAVLQHLLEERAQQVVGELDPVGDAWPSAHTTSRTLVPSSHSITSTRDVRERVVDLGHVDARVRGHVAAMVCALRASIRKSSSSRSRAD